MTITSTSSAAAQTSRTTPVASEAAGQFDMFLKLLTTQMQNQDPLDPMDTSEYTQQLVQYSQVEQSVQQTGLLKQMLERMSSSDLTEAAGLIGRTVQFGSSVAALTDAAPARWSWTLPRAAASVVAEVRDSSGKLVATPAVTAGGTGELSWDGLQADGTRAPAGAYSLKLTAKDASGEAVAATVTSAATVAEVVQRDGELWLGLGGKVALPLSDLMRVAAPGG